MSSAHDVAAYILHKNGSMTAMKLEKLVYYAQAWSLVWDEKPLFSDRIEAWPAGPVVPALYYRHRNQFMVGQWENGDAGKIAPEQRETIDAILGFYGDKSAQWLSDLTHKEDPWLAARRGLAPLERGNREITHASMQEYYQAVQGIN